MDAPQIKYIKEPSMLDSLIRQSLINLPTDKSGRLLDVNVSRKGPFLSVDSKGKRINAVCSVSEFALPFIDLKEYKHITLRDDAVYYGTTFERITELLLTAYALKGGNVSDLSLYSVPLAQSKDALPVFSYMNGKRHVNPGIAVLEPAHVGSYINTYIDHINELHRPYDIEVPIFRFKYNTEMLEDSLIDMLTSKLKNKYSTKVHKYKTERYNRKLSATKRKPISTHVWTVILDDIFANKDSELNLNIKPDFSKLRIYFNTNNKEVLISCYCINDISDDMLTESKHPFTDEFADKIWDELVRRATFRCNIPSTIDDFTNSDLFAEYDKDIKSTKLENLIKNYEEQAHRSLVVAANYFISYALFQEINPIIKETFNVQQITLNKDELYWLFGPEMAESMFEVLECCKNVLKRDEHVQGEQSVEGLIPLAYSTDYASYLDLFMRSKVDRLGSYEARVSSIFSAMHYGIEMKSRLRSSNVNKRLQFGETFTSLYNQMYWLTVQEESDLRMQIHKALDARIDSGSIVPQYVKRNTSNGYSWSRHFRPGENDDAIFDRTIRQLGSVFNRLSDITGRTLITRSQAIFMLMYINHWFKDSWLRIFDSEISFRFEDGRYNAITKINGSDYDIFELSVNCGVIDDNHSLISISHNAISNNLLAGDLLYNQEEQMLDVCLRHIAAFLNLSPNSDTFYREASNWLKDEDEETVSDKLNYLLEQLSTLNLSQDKGDILDVANDISTSFFNIYMSIPDIDYGLSNIVNEIEDENGVFHQLFTKQNKWEPIVRNMELLYFIIMILNIYSSDLDLPEPESTRHFLFRYKDEEILMISDGINPRQRLDAWISNPDNDIYNLPTASISGVIKQILSTLK